MTKKKIREISVLLLIFLIHNAILGKGLLFCYLCITFTNFGHAFEYFLSIIESLKGQLLVSCLGNLALKETLKS